MIEPEFRCATKRAIDELASELNLVNEPGMQDWEYEVAEPNDIERYITHYKKLTDDDKRFVLMEIIIQATNDQPDTAGFSKYWNVIKPLLQNNFKIHEYSVFYWSCFDNKNIEDCFTITPNMRELWNNKINEV
ncbi:MAG TPA: hypothetical protein VK890_08140 [Bacteroidia bacterium]|jgi:hypothetical protein|nr:hypothetical protein [Bacteroidia bacterium]